MAGIAIDEGDEKGAGHTACAGHDGLEGLPFGGGGTGKTQRQRWSRVVVEDAECGGCERSERGAAGGVAQAQLDGFRRIKYAVIDQRHNDGLSRFAIGKLDCDWRADVITASQGCTVAEVDPHADRTILAISSLYLDNSCC